MNRRTLLLGLTVLPVAARAQVAPAHDVRIVYLTREGDAAYRRSIGPDGVDRDPAPSPFPGAEVAVRDSAALARALDVSFHLDRQDVAEDGDIAAAVKQAVSDGAAAIIADVPEADLIVAAKAAPSGQIAVFNIRHVADALRAKLCGSAVFHVMPEQAALSDALVQFIVRKNWRRVLILFGPIEDDQAVSARFQLSAKKFGARVVDAKPFIYGNDPRKREQISVALMTADTDYDVVFVADASGDFGRFVAYEQVRPRPVMGSTGLQASAWHALAERYGAPQMNHRFERLAKRGMTDPDWCAWTAVRAVAEAIAQSKGMDAATIAGTLASDKFQMDAGKGLASSFRSWDRQLRQPILLHSADAVVAYAPLEGFIHETTDLDTLGLSAQEVACARG